MILVIEFALMPSLALTLGLIMAGAPERPERRDRERRLRCSGWWRARWSASVSTGSS